MHRQTARECKPCEPCLIQIGIGLERAFDYHEATCPARSKQRHGVEVYPWEHRDICDADLARAVEMLEREQDLWSVANDLGQPPSLLSRKLVDYQRRMNNSLHRDR